VLHVVDPEADLHRHLEMGDSAIGELAPDLEHFEPVEIARGLRGAGDAVADRRVDTLGRRSNNLDDAFRSPRALSALRSGEETTQLAVGQLADATKRRGQRAAHPNARTSAGSPVPPAVSTSDNQASTAPGAMRTKGSSPCTTRDPVALAPHLFRETLIAAVL
jgi:hypothetical protein